MKLSLKRFVVACIAIYLGITCYTAYNLIQKKYVKTGAARDKLPDLRRIKIKDDDDWNPWGEEFVKEGPKLPVVKLGQHDLHRNVLLRETKDSSKTFNVEIWGKAAIGLYLWQHILDGPLESRMGGVWSYGSKQIDNIKFTFRTGSGVIPEKVPENTENLILILNGREPLKIQFAQSWLDSLAQFAFLKNVAVILLGNEQCNNDWVKKYMVKNGGPIKFVFLVYDSPEVDDWNFYQWPLGVATYRQFPKVNQDSLKINARRHYTCNFLATIYKNSSRQQLFHILEEKKDLKTSCLTKARYEWKPLETEETLNDYIGALQSSDFTLNPVGKNTECYRIYEAMSLGSIPIIEDNMTPGNCGNSNISHNAPLRLLKDHNAPVIYLDNWKDLPALLEKYKSLPYSEIVQKRRDMVDWYEKFLHKMRDKFVQTIQQRFFNL